MFRRVFVSSRKPRGAAPESLSGGRNSFPTRHSRRVRTLLLGAAMTLSLIPRAGSALAAPSAVHQNKPVLGTLVLQGSMNSSADISLAGAFSVGETTNLEWDLPLPTSVQVSGHTQQVTPSFTFDVPPTSSQDLTDDQGKAVRRFHWDTPPSNTVIHVTEKLHAEVTSTLQPFTNAAAFPLGAVPADVAPYLVVTPDLKLPDSVSSLITSFKSGKTTERQVVEAVANWVAVQVRYDPARTNGPFQASWILANHTAACRGYANIMAALLRRLGIPAQTQFGWVLGGVLNMPGPSHGNATLDWAQGTSVDLHTWLNVWFPDTGWTPFDPQSEKFFVDPRHIALFTNVDASTGLVMGGWTADQSDDNASPTGASLSNGDIEIIPGNGASTDATAHIVDSFHLKFRHINHDVAGLMFSR